MTPQQYLENRLKNCSRHKLSPEEEEGLEFLGTKAFLLS